MGIEIAANDDAVNAQSHTGLACLPLPNVGFQDVISTSRYHRVIETLVSLS